MARKKQEKIERIKDRVKKQLNFLQTGEISNFDYKPGEKVELATIPLTIDKSLANKLVETINQELSNYGKISFYAFDEKQGQAIIYPNTINPPENYRNPNSWPNPILSRYYATQQFLLRLPKTLKEIRQKRHI